jgi:tetratricopeptide (TPR) repeat protein
MKRSAIILFLFAFQHLLSQTPFNRVRHYLHDDKTKEAAVVVDSCLIGKYQVDSALFYSGMVNIKFHNLKAARDDYKKLVREYPGYFDAHYLHGLILYASEDYAKSIDEFNKTIESSPHHVKAYYNRALALGMTENYSLCVEDLDKCITLDSTFAHAYYSRAYWKEFMGKFDEAAADYEAVIRLEPRSYFAYFGLAYCWQMRNDNGKACEAVTRAIAAGSQVGDELKDKFCK